MSTAAIYRERARQALEHSGRHDAMAQQSGYGDAGHHRDVSDRYRELAMGLSKLAQKIGGGGE